MAACSFQGDQTLTTDGHPVHLYDSAIIVGTVEDEPLSPCGKSGLETGYGKDEEYEAGPASFGNGLDRNGSDYRRSDGP